MKKQTTDEATRLDEKHVNLRAFIWGLTQGILEAESDKSRPHKWATPNLERVKSCAKH